MSRYYIKRINMNSTAFSALAGLPNFVLDGSWTSEYADGSWTMIINLVNGSYRGLMYFPMTVSEIFAKADVVQLSMTGEASIIRSYYYDSDVSRDFIIPVECTGKGIQVNVSPIGKSAPLDGAQAPFVYKCLDDMPFDQFYIDIQGPRNGTGPSNDESYFLFASEKDSSVLNEDQDILSAMTLRNSFQYGTSSISGNKVTVSGSCGFIPRICQQVAQDDTVIFRGSVYGSVSNGVNSTVGLYSNGFMVEVKNNGLAECFVESGPTYQGVNIAAIGDDGNITVSVFGVSQTVPFTNYGSTTMVNVSYISSLFADAFSFFGIYVTWAGTTVYFRKMYPRYTYPGGAISATFPANFVTNLVTNPESSYVSIGTFPGSSNLGPGSFNLFAENRELAMVSRGQYCSLYVGVNRQQMICLGTLMANTKDVDFNQMAGLFLGASGASVTYYMKDFTLSTLKRPDASTFGLSSTANIPPSTWWNSFDLLRASSPGFYDEVPIITKFNTSFNNMPVNYSLVQVTLIDAVHQDTSWTNYNSLTVMDVYATTSVWETVYQLGKKISFSGSFRPSNFATYTIMSDSSVGKVRNLAYILESRI